MLTRFGAGLGSHNEMVDRLSKLTLKWSSVAFANAIGKAKTLSQCIGTSQRLALAPPSISLLNLIMSIHLLVRICFLIEKYKHTQQPTEGCQKRFPEKMYIGDLKSRRFPTAHA
jgi:hypothetical protein